MGQFVFLVRGPRRKTLAPNLSSSEIGPLSESASDKSPESELSKKLGDLAVRMLLSNCHSRRKQIVWVLRNRICRTVQE